MELNWSGRTMDGDWNEDAVEELQDMWSDHMAVKMEPV